MPSPLASSVARVAAVEVGKDFDVGHGAGVRGEQHGQRHGVVVQLVHEDVGGGVVGIDAIDGEDGRADGVVGDREREGLAAAVLEAPVTELPALLP